MNAFLRLLSIDAQGGLTVAAMLMVNNAGDWNHVWPWLEHAAWHGCHPADHLYVPLHRGRVASSMATGGALSRGARWRSRLGAVPPFGRSPAGHQHRPCPGPGR